MMEIPKLHYFDKPLNPDERPKQFTYPFHYTPHPWTMEAARQVQDYLSQRTDWNRELQAGKMFGVLVVETPGHAIGFLAAFSGNLAGSNQHTYFVPPVYDLLQPDGFFRIEEAQISAINDRIRCYEKAPEYRQAREELQTLKNRAEEALLLARQQEKEAKRLREEKRKSGHLTDEEQAALIRESQFGKAELKRQKTAWQSRIDEQQQQVALYEKVIENCKQERKQRSAALQMRLFGAFNMLNARGETKDLCAIFAPTSQGVPPAGAGECAAPKLLQYAYQHQLKPLAMGEFWWGASPKEEIRHHGHFYPSCKGKCEPILGHMLQGLDVEPNPLLADTFRNAALEIVYEDAWLVVVNKPAGMLSVPGKNDLDSIQQRLMQRYPEADGPLIVHRLDMATSGLLLAAKTKEVHQALQKQFENRTIRKRYTALLDGKVAEKNGRITLPLCLNPMDRPRQMVDTVHGKAAITDYQVIEETEAYTRVYFYPHTGRTHQLRVHAAHKDGLNTPIKGDELYGRKADRMYLHAAELHFIHPVTGKEVHVVKEAPF